MLRVGIDLGGTKIEAMALDGAREVFRKRVGTPRGDYGATIVAVAALVHEIGEGSVGLWPLFARMFAARPVACSQPRSERVLRQRIT